MDCPRRFIAYVVDPDRLGTAVPHLKTPHVPRKGTAPLDAPGKIPLDMTDEFIAAFHRANDLRHLFVELAFMNDLIYSVFTDLPGDLPSGEDTHCRSLQYRTRLWLLLAEGYDSRKAFGKDVTPSDAE
jgi:hypothetical protein